MHVYFEEYRYSTALVPNTTILSAADSERPIARNGPLTAHIELPHSLRLVTVLLCKIRVAEFTWERGFQRSMASVRPGACGGCGSEGEQDTPKRCLLEASSVRRQTGRTLALFLWDRSKG